MRIPSYPFFFSLPDFRRICKCFSPQAACRKNGFPVARPREIWYNSAERKVGALRPKTLYITARSHMDPVWLRCFTDHFLHPDTGDVIRPYAEAEELQILEYMELAERWGVVCHIEQTLTVKTFLERNPDQRERFGALVRRGLLELAGGGETVIDVNLTQGESWVRNQLYSREYLQREFGRTPRYAITPDIFGLASQLPQFFRSVGYDALIVFDRVLKNNKPFWRGLDGTCIVLDPRFLQPPEPALRTADCVKLPACPVCRGEGCEACAGTGLDTSYTMTRPGKELQREAYYGNMTAEELLDRLLETDRDEYHVMITTEEPRYGGFLFGPLRRAAEKRGVTVRYLGFEDRHDVWCPGLTERLRRHDFGEDEIDTRPEGNPAGCGCYSTRIECKKANRDLEDLLLEAEALAALARLNGGWRPGAVPRRDYPQKAVAALWSKMALLQFHDCVTGTHVDAAVGELRRTAREIRRGAERVYLDAAAAFCEGRSFGPRRARYAAVAFNPTAYPAARPLLTLSAPAGTRAVAVYDQTGAPVPVLEQTLTPALAGTAARLRVEAEIPPFGWRRFDWEPAEPLPPAPAPAGTALRIENEFFRIEQTAAGETRVSDKKRGRTALRHVGLAIGEDIGSPWGRGEPERGHRALIPDSVNVQPLPHGARLALSGSLRDPANGIERLTWTETLTLFEREDLVRVRTVLDWHGRNTRVFASFTPDLDPADRLYCEVPFGTMARSAPEDTGVLGVTDEWPSLGFAGVSDGGYSLAVLKGGLPGTRLKDGMLQISLLRAVGCAEPRYRGENDPGTHTAEYALAAWAGDFAAGACAARAAAFRQRGVTFPLAAPDLWEDPDAAPGEETAPAGQLLAALNGLPAALRVSAVKWAQDGSCPVVRFYESAGLPALLKLPEGWRMLRCDSLERPLTDERVSEYAFRPFELATFRLLHA